MASNLFNRYIWLVDTIRRYGRITRQELDECWRRSQFSDGKRKLPRRTFYNYRAAIEELFSLSIECDPRTYEYFIRDDEGHNESVTTWMLNSAVMNNVLANSRNISERIFIENVPSARDFLAPVIEALREHHAIRFTYHAYTRSRPAPGIVVEPYFLKLFKQRWYITGRAVADDKVKTYALDRMSELIILTDTFEDDPTFEPEEYFRNSFGIVFTQSEVKRVALRTSPRQAKYFRALPLHATQEEVIHDEYSIFYYNLRLSPDFVEEILSHGPRVEVLSPPELRAMVRSELREALNYYEVQPDSVIL